MIIDVVRHKFAEALLTMFFMAVVLMAVSLAMLDAEAVAVAEGGAIAPLRLWLDEFVAGHPLLSAFATLPLFVYAVLTISRAVVRVGMYTSSTMAPIALYAISVVALVSCSQVIPLLVVASLLALAIARLIRSLGPSVRAHRLFTSMIAFGALPLVDGSLLAISVLMPLLAILLRRTVRETVIILAGALLPTFIFCYLSWCFGGSFVGAAQLLIDNMLNPPCVPLSDYLHLPRLIFVGLLLLTQLIATLFYISERVSISLGARSIWLILILSLLLIIPAFVMLPSFSAASILAVAMISVAMIPLPILRLGGLSGSLYFLIMLVLSIVAAISW